MKNPLVLWLTLSVAVAPLYAASVSVSVVDENGAPIEEASVQLESFATSPRGFIVSQTGVDGTTSFDMETGKLSPDFLGRIVVWKPGFALGGTSLQLDKPARIVLKKGAALQGVVLDSTKKPVKGALIDFSLIQSDDRANNPVLYDGPLKAKMETLSDENGAWQLDNLPANASIFVSIVAPGFARESPSGKTGETIQTQLRPGASIHGKLLGLDGQPLGKVRVHAQPINSNVGRSSYAVTSTGADGTFDLSGLETGTFNVMFSLSGERGYVVPAFESVSLLAGDSKVLPEARAVEGIFIGGKVVEKGTDKPVTGATIGVYGAMNPASSAAISSAASDEKGFWKLRGLPGQSRIYISGIPPGFLRDSQTKNLEIGPQGDLNLNFELERAPKITGKFVDEAGQGIAASMVVSQQYEEWRVKSDENGNFEVYGPKNGEIEFGTSRWFPTNDASWDVVGSAKRTIPAAGPLEIKLAKSRLANFEARVYDDQDAAIDGVRIDVWVATGTGDRQAMQPRDLTTDKNGLARIEGLRANQSVAIKSIRKSGYDLMSPISEFVMERKDGLLRPKDIILKKRDGKIVGQVLDSQGETVGDAQVFASGVETLTAKDGQFVLQPLPGGKTEVFALNDDEFALVAADKEARIELKKQSLQPVDKDFAARILEEVKQQSKNTRVAGRSDTDLESVADFEKYVAKIGTEQNIAALSRFIDRYGADSGIDLTRWISLLAADPKAANRLFLSGMLARARRKLKDDETTRAWLEDLQYDAAQIIEQNDLSDRLTTGNGLFTVAFIAEKIGDTAMADKAFADATAFVLKNYGDKRQGNTPSRDEMFASLGESVGSSPRLLEKLLVLVEPESSSYSNILRAAIPQIARSAGLESAKPWLEKLKKAPTPKPDANGNSMSVDWAYWESVVKAIESGGKSNPVLALEIAKSLPVAAEYGNYDIRDKALIAAAFFQEKAVAEPIWRDTLPHLEAGLAMKSIARIARSDEKLGRELYETTRRNLDSMPEDDPNAMIAGRQRDIPAFVFYEAKFNPARARYRLEKVFLKAKNDENTRYTIVSYIRAMAVLDAARALQWAESIENVGNNFNQFNAKRGIAQWLGSDEKRRENANFAAPYSQEWDFQTESE